MPKDPSTELATEATDGPDLSGAQWFGHPRGLATLFFTEMWERFSYYGMRALLVLFMTAPLAAANAGLGYGAGKAGAIYGLYTSMVYLLALPGGWVADKLWGQRRAVFVGGCIIAVGHFSMAGPVVGLPEEAFFFLGLCLIVIGTGLLKPNVSTMVGDLYPVADEDAAGGDEAGREVAKQAGARRDAGFSIFYMGINVGAILGPFICGTLGENVNWHWGFSVAGFGMVLGLIQYKLGGRHLGRVGELGSDEDRETLGRRARNFYLTAGGIAAAAVLFVFLAVSGVVPITLEEFATWLGYAILLLTILFFTYLIMDVRWAAGLFGVFLAMAAVMIPLFGSIDGGRNATVGVLAVFILANLVFLGAGGDRVTMEKRRLMVIFWLFLLAAIFWSGFEQAGSSLNLFARDMTDRVFDLPGWVESVAQAVVSAGAAVIPGVEAPQIGDLWEMPTTWLQNVNPLFIVLLAPVFGWLWTWLASRDSNPSIPVKFGLGLVGLSAGFFVLSWGAANATAEDPASVSWLVVTYFLHTCGELCLSPVGLSSMTKLAPRGRVGQMMGVWFIAAALGNLFAGLVAGQLETLAPMDLFRIVAMIIGGAGLFGLLLSQPVRKLMGHVD